jgi:hypothetical protein
MPEVAHVGARNSSRMATPNPRPRRSSKPQADCVELPRKALRDPGAASQSGVSVEVDLLPLAQRPRTGKHHHSRPPKSHQQFFRVIQGVSLKSPSHSSPGCARSLCKPTPSSTFSLSKTSINCPQSAFGEHLSPRLNCKCGPCIGALPLPALPRVRQLPQDEPRPELRRSPLWASPASPSPR